MNTTEPAPAHTIVARFAVTGWEPVTLPAVDGDWAAGLTMRKEYTSGLVGEGVLHFVSSGSEASGQAYLAVERITGTLDDGRAGSLTVHHGALQVVDGEGGSSAFGYIIPGSGTGDFSAFGGSARIEHDDDGAFFSLELAD